MSKQHKAFALPVRVYYQDTDAGGVVYHASYVNFMERARTEWLRTFGYTGLGMMQEFGMLFVVRSLKVEYFRPALLDDMLDVSADIKDIGRSRMTVHQQVRRAEELLAEGEVHLVCVTRDAFKPVAIPDVLKNQWLD
jgi:acyl-CoA thioester hydrolase